MHCRSNPRSIVPDAHQIVDQRSPDLLFRIRPFAMAWAKMNGTRIASSENVRRPINSVREERLAMTDRNTIVATFDNQNEAMQTVADLQQAGFTRDEIGVVTRDEIPASARNTATGETKAGEGAAVGVATGAG